MHCTWHQSTDIQQSLELQNKCQGKNVIKINTCTDKWSRAGQHLWYQYDQLIVYLCTAQQCFFW